MTVRGGEVSSVVKELCTSLIHLDLDIQREFLVLVDKQLMRFFVNIEIKDFLLLKHRHICIGVFFTLLEGNKTIEFWLIGPVLTVSNPLESLGYLQLMRVFVLLNLFGFLANIDRFLSDVTIAGVVHNLRVKIRLIHVKLVHILF